MPLQKTAIAVPADVLRAVDDLARARGVSRSALITRILRAALRAKRDREITARLDALFADDAVRAEQRAGVVDVDWTPERW